MKTIAAALSVLLLLALGVFVDATDKKEGVAVRLKLTDADSGEPMGGMIRVFRAGSKAPISMPELLDRNRGFRIPADKTGWRVVPKEGARTTLPGGKLRIEALSGLETALTSRELTVTEAGPLDIKLHRIFRPEERSLVAGNTHLHLRDMTLEQSDRYLREIPVAEGLDVLFISYLERADDDKAYTTNRYPVGDLKHLDDAGVLINNGEEHRHNLKGYGQGYGHVMLLDLQRLVKPVSIGKGIMKAGLDQPSLRVGIDNARAQGGTIVWCHNTLGFESIPTALADRLDALNVFDGSGGREQDYAEHYYRFLNIGQRLPISTGTDWFLYDFSRVYAKLTDDVTVDRWLAAVKAGRCSITNGPLLSLTVDGRELGDVLALSESKPVRIEATARGRLDFKRVQLIRNGIVVDSAPAKKDGPGFTARLAREVRLDGPCWFAARIETATENEFGQRLFAHTSPIYIDVAGKRVFDVDAARALLVKVQEGKSVIATRAEFSDPTARARVLALYDAASEDLLKRINRRAQ